MRWVPRVVPRYQMTKPMGSNRQQGRWAQCRKGVLWKRGGFSSGGEVVYSLLVSWLAGAGTFMYFVTKVV